MMVLLLSLVVGLLLLIRIVIKFLFSPLLKPHLFGAFYFVFRDIGVLGGFRLI